jgi:hypothetical protein
MPEPVVLSVVIENKVVVKKVMAAGVDFCAPIMVEEEVNDRGNTGDQREPGSSQNKLVKSVKLETNVDRPSVTWMFTCRFKLSYAWIWV